MTTLFVKRLTVIDCSVLQPGPRPDRRESWQVDVELDGDLDYQGMVLDFGEVKEIDQTRYRRAVRSQLLVPPTTGPAGRRIPRGCTCRLPCRMAATPSIAHRAMRSD